jgi:hypothetical protein
MSSSTSNPKDRLYELRQQLWEASAKSHEGQLSKQAEEALIHRKSEIADEIYQLHYEVREEIPLTFSSDPELVAILREQGIIIEYQPYVRKETP